MKCCTCRAFWDLFWDMVWQAMCTLDWTQFLTFGTMDSQPIIYLGINTPTDRPTNQPTYDQVQCRPWYHSSRSPLTLISSGGGTSPCVHPFFRRPTAARRPLARSQALILLALAAYVWRSCQLTVYQVSVPGTLCYSVLSLRDHSSSADM